jgi:hypothetical protein
VLRMSVTDGHSPAEQASELAWMAALTDDKAVLVPAPVSTRTNEALGHGAVADHHAPGVDAQVPGCVADLVGEGEHVGGDGVFLVGGRLCAGPQRSICWDQASCWPGE